MIMSTISPVGRSLGGPEACRGLTTEGSGADRPDVAGDVVTVAPIHFEAASPRKGREPETKSNHADIRNERTIRNLLTHQSAFMWPPDADHHHPQAQPEERQVPKRRDRRGRDLTRVLVIVHAPDVRGSDCLGGSHWHYPLRDKVRPCNC
jgi:hypothetical protein